MTLKSKLCGFSNLKSLQYAIDHPYSPALIGFIVNFPKSKRYVDTTKLNKLINIDKKKIISAITVEKKEDVNKYKDFISVSDIILFDSKGYEQSLGWDHNFLNDLPDNINKMVAGNIQFDDDIDKYKKICNYIDISGGIESSGVKDISKIDIFLNKVKKVNNEN